MRPLLARSSIVALGFPVLLHAAEPPSPAVGQSPPLASPALPAPSVAPTTAAAPDSNSAAAAKPPAKQSRPAIFAPRTSPSGSPPAAASAPVARPAAKNIVVRPRAISSETLANLRSSTPKFDPAKAAPAEAAASTDIQSSDTLSGDAHQLDPFVVQEDKVLQLKEREILTPKGKADLAKRRYPYMNARDAMASLEADLHRERIQEMRDLGSLMDPKVSKDIKRQTDQMSIRPSERVDREGTPFREPSR